MLSKHKIGQSSRLNNCRITRQKGSLFGQEREIIDLGGECRGGMAETFLFLFFDTEDMQGLPQWHLASKTTSNLPGRRAGRA